MRGAKPFLYTAICCLTSLSAFAAEEQGGFFDITDENDAWSDFLGKHQDRHYTHGTKVTFMLPEHTLTDTVIPLWGLHDAVTSKGFVLGQNMYTPENILDPNPIPTDHPYAGWLYTGMVYQRRGEYSDHLAVLENFEINLGIVGPLSLAGQTQRLIHRWRFPEDIPAGWDNQLKNEPGLALKYARLWRWSPTEETAKYFDIIPRAGVEVGNVAILATAGATLRIGLNLPNDFGQQIIDSLASNNGGLATSPQWSAYFFAGVDGRAIAHDITLDGNTFRGGPHVEKRDFVDDMTLGVAFQPCRYFEIRYAHINRSRQFHGQQGNDVFGSIDIRWMFSF
ncbi:MAG TPA: lipid A deacylase LpxR family protein [Candidatus Acidoferrales bacterium]|jgi:lipid A 3-O-deacylase|nr:lipid A deacylase LpxR family protein [Candidatus Acidoferrales bacterium]